MLIRTREIKQELIRNKLMLENKKTKTNTLQVHWITVFSVKMEQVINGMSLLKN